MAPVKSPTTIYSKALLPLTILGLACLCVGLLSQSAGIALPYSFLGSNTKAKSSGQNEWGPRPKQRTSGGGRNLCHELLVAVVPGQGNVDLNSESCGANSESKPSTTAMRSPTIWFYIPNIAPPGLVSKLLILKNGKLMYQSLQTINSTGGILPIAFNYELEPNVWYDWEFSLLNEPDHPTENPTVENSIQFIPSQALDRSQGSQEHRQDTLHSSAQRYCLNPEDPRQKVNWLKELQFIDLDGLHSVPLISCEPLSPRHDIDQLPQ